jgi:hypothetical protein
LQHSMCCMPQSDDDCNTLVPLGVRRKWISMT